MNSSTPLISVVLPVYNHGDLLGQSIESVLAQDFQDIELIVVNDGSTDNTAEILEEYSKKNTNSKVRLRCIEQENRGIAAALNRGFLEARGALLSWTSADNAYQPQALGLMKQFLHNNPKIDLVYANVQLIDAQGKPFTDSDYRKNDQDPLDNSILRLPKEACSLTAFNDNFINACFLYRKSLASRVGQYHSELLGFEDYDYWLRASLCGELTHIGIEEPLYKYRLHQDSLTANLQETNLSKSQLSLVERANKAADLIEDSPNVLLSSQANSLSSCFVSASKKTALLSSTARVQLETNLETQPLKVKLIESASSEICSLPFEIFDNWPGYIELESDNSTKHSCEPVCTWRTFAPFKLPKLLFRARCNNFGAVTAEADSSETSFLLLPSRLEFTKCKPTLVEQISTGATTYVLLCTNEEQREIADELFIELNSSRWIRIIDITSQSSDLLDAQGRLASLLYLCSSVDSITFPFTDSSSKCAVHLSAVISALSGIKLKLLGNNEETQEIRKELHEYLQTAGHIEIVNPGTILASSAISTPKHELLNSWLLTHSHSSFHKKVAGMCFARLYPSSNSDTKLLKSIPDMNIPTLFTI